MVNLNNIHKIIGYNLQAMQSSFTEKWCYVSLTCEEHPLTLYNLSAWSVLQTLAFWGLGFIQMRNTITTSLKGLTAVMAVFKFVPSRFSIYLEWKKTRFFNNDQWLSTLCYKRERFSYLFMENSWIT